MATLLVNLLLILLFDVCQSIDLKMYNNSVLYGDEMEIIALNSLDYIFTINDFKYYQFSAKIEGTISWLNNVDKYYFNCNWDPSIIGFFWIDDHLICAPGIYQEPVFAFWNLTWTVSANNKRKSFVRINIYSQIVNISNHIIIPFHIKWAFNNNNTFIPINHTFLSSEIDQYQEMRLLHQENLMNNSWSQWYFDNLLTVLRLPDSVGFTIGGCLSSTDCQINAIVEDGDLRVGVKSIDLQNSYFEYNFTYKLHEFQYEYATITDDDNDGISNLYVMIKYLGDPTDTAYVGVNTRFYWYRYGMVEIVYPFSNNNIDDFDNFDAVECGAIKAIPYGFNKTWHLCSNRNPSSHINNIDTLTILTFKVTANNPVYFTTNVAIKNVSEIANIINNSKQKEYATYKKYGNLSETKLAIQAGLMWNLMYTPEESVIAPVSRAWGSSEMPNGWDFNLILFNWDNIFASYMLSLDALNISISNLIQIIKAKTVNGFVPNYKTIHYPRIDSSEDRTETAIGSMVLNQMYLKYGDQIIWLIQLLFHDLYDWTDWFWRRRRCAPKNLICLGSDPNQPDFNNNENNMQSARYEALDNSPMYDGNFYDTDTHHMLLYDVGMNAMFMNELKCLMNLGNAINVNSDIMNTMKERYEFMVNATINELWDDSMNIFVNKFSQNDSFYPRISPTSFYPLITGRVSVQRCEMMVTQYLLNPDYFCINLNFPINQSRDCYYGLPSISHNDPAFRSQNYWRGLVWGPMAQIVWWSLDEYSNQSVIVKNAQIALQKQMNEMMLKIWNDKRHICENYSPSSKNNECTGTEFYHWGGLTGFLSLIHPYY